MENIVCTLKINAPGHFTHVKNIPPPLRSEAHVKLQVLPINHHFSQSLEVTESAFECSHLRNGFYTLASLGREEKHLVAPNKQQRNIQQQYESNKTA
jgi:hypothetical protein